jgi:ABC-type transporter Mla subunit MlaD
MDDAGDARDELGDALLEKDGAAAAAAASKIEGFMAKTEAYWAAKRAADIVKLAQTARALSKDVASAAGGNRIVLAQGAFDKLNTTCNACHDLHPEKR